MLIVLLYAYDVLIIVADRMARLWDSYKGGESSLEKLYVFAGY